MPVLFDHILFIVLAVLFPIRAGVFGLRRLRIAGIMDRPRVRMAVYRDAIALQWALCAAVLFAWISRGRDWVALGVVPQATIGFVVVLLLLAVTVAIVLRQRARVLKDDEALADVRSRLEHLEIMLPHDEREVRRFYLLSVTAGICEELLYRGFMIWYLNHWMDLIPAALVAAVVFGVAHAYQGARGMLLTGGMGVVFGALYVITESLLVPVVLHALVDLHSGHMAYRAYARANEEAIERAREWARERLALQAVQKDAQQLGSSAQAGGVAGVTGAAPDHTGVSSPAPDVHLPADASPDVIVVGLGAMGSAAADHLARRGLRVAAFDRFHPPHENGSSHGESRLIREAYFEHPEYVPLVQRAYELWQQLEAEAERPLLRITGGLMIGRPDGVLVRGALASARVHGLPYEQLSAAEVRAQYPAFRPDEAMVAIREPRTGVLYPEACIEEQLARAARNGAVLNFNEPVLSWRADDNGAEVQTARGVTRAAKLLLVGGAWTTDLLKPLDLSLTVTRQPLIWYAPRDAARFDPIHAPAHIWEHEPQRFFYGFPLLHGAVKAAFHIIGEEAKPTDLRPEVRADEITALTAVLERYMPELPGRCLRGIVCRYTNTPDGHFLIDWHPEHANVLVASACSGHGFKFASALGEVFADLLERGHSRFDLGLFRLDRVRKARPGNE